MPLLYMSENKILALEDAIQFCPSVFRLTKSVIVTEPLVEPSLGLDMTSHTQLKLRSEDPHAVKLNAKVSLMM